MRTKIYNKLLTRSDEVYAKIDKMYAEFLVLKTELDSDVWANTIVDKAKELASMNRKMANMTLLAEILKSFADRLSR